MKEGSMLKNIVFRIASMCITFAVTIMITSIVVTKLGDEMYGFYSLANDFVSYAAILSVALNSMSGRYITISYYEHNITDVNKFFNSILFSNVILSSVLVLPTFLIVYNLNKFINIPETAVNNVKALFMLIALNFFVSVISAVFTVATFIRNRVDLDSIRSAESNLIKFLIVVIFFYCIKPNIVFLGIGSLAATVYVFLTNIRYVKQLTPEIEIFNKKYFDIEYTKKVFFSGVWNSVTRIGAILLNGFDLLIANIMISSSAMGILSVSKTLPKYFLSAMQSFSAAFTPSVTIEYAQKNINKVVDNIKFAMKMCAIISNTIVTVIVVLGVKIYALWVPGQDSEKLHLLSVVAMIGLAFVLPMEPLWAVFTVTNKVKVSSLYLITESIIVISLVAVSLNFISEEIWKLVIISGVSSVAEVIRGFIFLPLLSAYYLKISKLTFYKTLMKILLSLIISTVMSYVVCSLFNGVSWIILIISCAVVCIISLFTGYAAILSKSERKKIIAYIFNKNNL